MLWYGELVARSNARCRQGTVSWLIEDDQGQADDIIIPNTPVCKALPPRLLSPQHWAQETERTGRVPLLGRWRPKSKTNADSTTLIWGRRKFTKTVTLDPWKKLAIITTKAGISKFFGFGGRKTF
jgi:hypothetical protein